MVGNSEEMLLDKKPSDQEYTIPEIDRFRSFVFPNNIRKYRKARRIESLLQLSQHIPSTTYIRLSKIERGEIFARAEEMRNIAAAIGVEVEQLLIDIDDPSFDIAQWAEHYIGPATVDMEADTLSVLLAAAVRSRRVNDEGLTIAVLESEYGIAPVILSRIENAFKPIDRWNAAIQSSLHRLFDVSNTQELIAYLKDAHKDGALDAMLPLVANPAERMAKTRIKLLSLRAELATPGRSGGRERLHSRSLGGSAHASSLPPAKPISAQRFLPVYGAALPDGLIAQTPTGDETEAPSSAGPRAYGLRINRSTLGAGLPGRTVLIIDPDRFPSAGGLAVVKQGEGLRLLAVTTNRQGQMIGFSEHPDMEMSLDGVDPQDLAGVIAAYYE